MAQNTFIQGILSITIYGDKTYYQNKQQSDLYYKLYDKLYFYTLKTKKEYSW